MFAVAWLTRRAHSLGFDELFTVWVASRPWSDLVNQTALDGFTPPLFYALVKLAALTGLRLEDLRVVPALFAALAVALGVRASGRAFGGRGAWSAVAVLAPSAFVLSFAHELRPYSALMAGCVYVMGELSLEDDSRRDRRAAVVALLATAVSYLGLLLVVLWLIECRRRQAWPRLAAVLLIGLGLCLPAALKAARMSIATSAATPGISWLPEPPSLSRVFFGLAAVPSEGWIEAVGAVGVVLLLWPGIRSNDAALRLPARAVLVFTTLVLALDAGVRIGFAPRYAVPSVTALLLAMVGRLARAGRAGLVPSALLLVLNIGVSFRYVTAMPAPREDWRGAMAAVSERVGSSGTLLAFPFHHAAVAAHAYAPGLRVGGGYTSRSGPAYWYEPPTAFRGYDFLDLQPIDDLRLRFDRLSATRDLCLLSDEPDPGKTARVFAAFAATGAAARLETGDPRIRVSCRPSGASFEPPPSGRRESSATPRP